MDLSTFSGEYVWDKRSGLLMGLSTPHFYLGGRKMVLSWPRSNASIAAPLCSGNELDFQTDAVVGFGAEIWAEMVYSKDPADVGGPLHLVAVAQLRGEIGAYAHHKPAAGQLFIDIQAAFKWDDRFKRDDATGAGGAGDIHA